MRIPDPWRVHSECQQIPTALVKPARFRRNLIEREKNLGQLWKTLDARKENNGWAGTVQQMVEDRRE